VSINEDNINDKDNEDYNDINDDNNLANKQIPLRRYKNNTSHETDDETNIIKLTEKMSI
jgi:hypothetical protein